MLLTRFEELVVGIKRTGLTEGLGQKVYVQDFGDGEIPGGDKG